MRDAILKLAIVAMLFVSMEGMAEAVDEASFHQSHHAHADDDQQWYPDSDGSDHEGEACEHFCHVHVVALTQVNSAPTWQGFMSFPMIRDAGTVSRTAAPPTPPPNI